MKRESHRFLRGVSVLLMLACLLTGLLVPAYAAGNTEVTAATKGVLQINMLYRDDNDSNLVISSGSCFLINNNTIVTCAHCVNLTDNDLAYLAENLYKTVPEIKNRLSYSVTVSRDVMITAKIMHMSIEMDYAILTLDSSLQNRSPVVLRSSSEVALTENVFAIGFPGESSVMQNVNTYTTEDVTITNGVVNKIATGLNIYSGVNYDYIQTNCKLVAGNSGGPLVDEEGNVIGVCEGTTGTEESGDDYSYAVAIDQVIDVCNALGIQYEIAGAEATPAPTPVPSVAPTAAATAEPERTVDISSLQGLIDEANALSADGYTPESYSAVTEALNIAQSAVNSSSQSEVDRAADSLERAMSGLQAKSGLGLPTILLLVAGAAVLAIVIIVLVLVNNSKKKARARKTEATEPPSNPQYDGRQGASMQGGQSTMPVGGATTLLHTDAGATTVLAHGGTLIRVRDGQHVELNSAELTLGRDSRNSYVIRENSSVSRNHAKIVIRDHTAYLIDLGTPNGTTVNGVRLIPRQETPLKDGDKICLADEEFQYRA